MLKQKKVIFALAVLFGVTLGYFFLLPSKIGNSVSIVRVLISGPVPGDFLSEPVLEDARQRLGAQFKEAAEDRDIKPFLNVSREGQTAVFQIQARHPNPVYAAALALSTAEAISNFLHSDLRRPYEARLEMLDLHIADLSKQCESIASEIIKVEESFQKSDVDQALEKKLKQKAALYRSKAELLKESHPDMLDLQRDIENLEVQLAESPRWNPSVLSALKESFAQKRSEQHQDQRDRDELALKLASLTSPLKILDIHRQSRLSKSK